MRETIFQLIQDQGDLSAEQIVTRIGVSALLGGVIFASYYLSHRGTIYSRKFNVSLVVLAVLTGTVMVVIGNNIALSLGMVGALSIVRFRTAVKDSRDTLYIFWAIIVGICCGVASFFVAAAGSCAVFAALRRGEERQPHPPHHPGRPARREPAGVSGVPILREKGPAAGEEHDPGERGADL